MLLLGTDEAGYGPNLGPLVIAVTAWSVPDDIDLTALDQHLSKVVARKPPTAKSRHDRFVVADSKELYDPARGLEVLERQMLSALGLAGITAASWRELWRCDALLGDDQLDGAPWHADYDEPLPVAAQGVDATRIGALADALYQRGVRIERLRARVVFPGEFNRLLDQFDSKGSLLSHLTLELLCRMLRELPEGNVVALCDKHGARNRYGPMLQPHVDEWIEVVCESAEQSVYRWQGENRRVELRLQPRCEAHLPTALASMTAKYLRELAMRAFNDFWRRHRADLKSTAGYATDARRFKAEIEPIQRHLGIDDGLLWRRK